MFNLDHRIIKEVDDEMLATERKYFMVPLDGWGLRSQPLDIKLKRVDLAESAKRVPQPLLRIVPSIERVPQVGDHYSQAH